MPAEEGEPPLGLRPCPNLKERQSTSMSKLRVSDFAADWTSTAKDDVESFARGRCEDTHRTVCPACRRVLSHIADARSQRGCRMRLHIKRRRAICSDRISQHIDFL